MTITEFLLARIAEDEWAAQEAITEIERIAWTPGMAPSTTALGGLWCDPDGMGVHVAAQPGRVLAECQAKRAIVEYRAGIRWPSDEAHDAVRNERDRTLRLLAAVYADHPDYRQEWKP